MVWSQYVYEATMGLDAYMSDEDEYNQDTPLNIEEWEVKYSDELWMMWGTIQTLLYDAIIDHTCTFTDFVAFCYTEHDDLPYQVDTSDERLFHVWRNIRRIVNTNGLHEEVMRGATFSHFCDFIQEKM
jgi:hypothetical protein